MRTVAIIAYDFSRHLAGGSVRAAEFARRLPEHGWRTVVITASPPEDHPELPETAEGIYIPSAERSFGGGIRASSGDASLGGNPAWLKALAGLKALVPLERQMSWTRPFRARFSSEEPALRLDAVLTITAPYSMMSLGRWLAQKAQVPQIIDLRDDWVDRYRIERRTAANRFLMDRYAEHHLARAEAVTVVSPLTVERLGTRGIRAHLVPNGYVESDFAGIPMVAPEIKAGPDLEVLHMGWLGGFRTMAPLLEAVSALQSRRVAGADQIRIRQVGVVEPDEQARLSQMPTSVILSFESQVPHAEAIALMARADVLLAIPGNEIPAAISGKLYEYLRARRPILLLAAEGAATRVARDAGVRWIADPTDAEAIGQALESILADKAAGILRTGSRDGAVAEFERGRGVVKLAEILDGAASR